MTKARIGPSIAPIASIARWTPNAVPSFSFGTLNEMSASRGAVLRPLPRRSMTSIPAIPVHAVVASSPRRDAAEPA